MIPAYNIFDGNFVITLVIITEEHWKVKRRSMTNDVEPTEPVPSIEACRIFLHTIQDIIWVKKLCRRP